MKTIKTVANLPKSVCLNNAHKYKEFHTFIKLFVSTWEDSDFHFIPQYFKDKCVWAKIIFKKTPASFYLSG